MRIEYPTMSPTVSPVTGIRTQEKVRRDRAPLHGTAKSTLECLIVSTHSGRREWLSQAAEDNGWSPLVCGDADTARHLANRIAVKLAIVDLERPAPGESGGLRELSSELAQAGGPLLVLCGADGDLQQEIWARQLGAWLYVSGLDDADTEGVNQLCCEARCLVERTGVESLFS
jgi:hypothetical protein